MPGLWRSRCTLPKGVVYIPSISKIPGELCFFACSAIFTALFSAEETFFRVLSADLIKMKMEYNVCSAIYKNNKAGGTRNREKDLYIVLRGIPLDWFFLRKGHLAHQKNLK